MRIETMDHDALLQAAKHTFPDYYIDIKESDLFMKGKQAGRYRADWLEHEFYISTEYAYEDRLVNGNQTRYKIAMPCILLKKDRYEVVYDMEDRYYAAFIQDNHICFEPYHMVLERLWEQTELLEEKIPV